MARLSERIQDWQHQGNVLLEDAVKRLGEAKNGFARLGLDKLAAGCGALLRQANEKVEDHHIRWVQGAAS